VLELALFLNSVPAHRAMPLSPIVFPPLSTETWSKQQHRRRPNQRGACYLRLFSRRARPAAYAVFGRSAPTFDMLLEHFEAFSPVWKQVPVVFGGSYMLHAYPPLFGKPNKHPAYKADFSRPIGSTADFMMGIQGFSLEGLQQQKAAAVCAGHQKSAYWAPHRVTEEQSAELDLLGIEHSPLRYTVHPAPVTLASLRWLESHIVLPALADTGYALDAHPDLPIPDSQCNRLPEAYTFELPTTLGPARVNGAPQLYLATSTAGISAATILLMFASNPNLQELWFILLAPFELAQQSPSHRPRQFRLEFGDGCATFLPDGQPNGRVLINVASTLTIAHAAGFQSAPELCVAQIATCGPYHAMRVTKGQGVASLRFEHHMPSLTQIPSLRNRDDHPVRYLSQEAFLSLCAWARTVNSLTGKQVELKIRQDRKTLLSEHLTPADERLLVQYVLDYASLPDLEAHELTYVFTHMERFLLWLRNTFRWLLKPHQLRNLRAFEAARHGARIQAAWPRYVYHVAPNGELTAVLEGRSVDTWLRLLIAVMPHLGVAVAAAVAVGSYFAPRVKAWIRRMWYGRDRPRMQLNRVAPPGLTRTSEDTFIPPPPAHIELPQDCITAAVSPVSSNATITQRNWRESIANRARRDKIAGKRPAVASPAPPTPYTSRPPTPSPHNYPDLAGYDPVRAPQPALPHVAATAAVNPADISLPPSPAPLDVAPVVNVATATIAPTAPSAAPVIWEPKPLAISHWDIPWDRNVDPAITLPVRPASCPASPVYRLVSPVSPSSLSDPLPADNVTSEPVIKMPAQPHEVAYQSRPKEAHYITDVFPHRHRCHNPQWIKMPEESKDPAPYPDNGTCLFEALAAATGNDPTVIYSFVAKRLSAAKRAALETRPHKIFSAGSTELEIIALACNLNVTVLFPDTNLHLPPGVKARYGWKDGKPITIVYRRNDVGNHWSYEPRQEAQRIKQLQDPRPTSHRFVKPVETGGQGLVDELEKLLEFHDYTIDVSAAKVHARDINAGATGTIER
jgi:hypothetical protein